MATSAAFAAAKPPVSPPGPRTPNTNTNRNAAHRDPERAGAAARLGTRLSSQLKPPPRAPPLHVLVRRSPFPFALLALVALLAAASALAIAALSSGHSSHLLHYRGRVVKVSLGGSTPITLDEGALRGTGPVKTGYSRYQPVPGMPASLANLSRTSRDLGIALAVFLSISAAVAAASAVAAAAGFRGRPAWAVLGIVLPFTVFGLLVGVYLSSLAALAGGLRSRAGGLLGGLVKADVTADQNPGAAWACAAASCAAWLFAVMAAMLVPRGG